MSISRLPGVEYAAPPRVAGVASGLSWPPKLVVIHDTGNLNGDRYAEANYAANRTDDQRFWTSAHFYVDRGGVLGSSPLDIRAWAAYSYANGAGWHLELCRKDIGNPTALTSLASLARALCALGGIPAVKLTPSQVAAGARGVCGHADITIGLGVGDHMDPDPFDWPAFMAQVTTSSNSSESEDDMGASFGPIDINPTGVTSLTIPPVQAGAADPRPAWLNVCNDTGSAKYGLRLWGTRGDGAWFPLSPDSSPAVNGDGKVVLSSGQRLSVGLPAGTSSVSIYRQGVNAAGALDDAAAPYASHLTCAIERGGVVH